MKIKILFIHDSKQICLPVFFNIKYEKPFCICFYFYVYIFQIFADVIDNKRINQAWKQIQQESLWR